MKVTDGSLQPLQPLHGWQALREIFICTNFASEELRVSARALPLARAEFVDSFRHAV